MEPTASQSARHEPAPDVEALVALLDCEADLDALERALLVATLHPAGAGADQAWLARWDERRGLLEGWRARSDCPDEPELATCIARARRAPPVDDAETERVRTWGSPPDLLVDACALAWHTGVPAVGTGAEQPGTPWDGCDAVCVLPLRRGARSYGLLVAGWHTAPAQE